MRESKGGDGGGVVKMPRLNSKEETHPRLEEVGDEDEFEMVIIHFSQDRVSPWEGELGRGISVGKWFLGRHRTPGQ